MKFILYGASGHGLVVADILTSANLGRVLAFLDDNPAKSGSYGGATLMRLSDLSEDILRDPNIRAIVTIGRNAIRMTKAKELADLGLRLGVAIHPSAVIAPSASVGEGTVIMAQAAVNSAVRIGRCVIINTGATIDHECSLGDGVHVSPGANLAGNVAVGPRVHIGIGAAVIHGISIGAEAVIGAGAVVIRDVSPGATVVGNPAMQLKSEREA